MSEATPEQIAVVEQMLCERNLRLKHLYQGGRDTPARAEYEAITALTIELTTLQTLLASAALIAFQDGSSIYRDGDRWRYCRDEVESEGDFGSVGEAFEALREEI